MPRVLKNVPIIGILVILSLMMIKPFAAQAQTTGTLQPDFSQAIVALHLAESSGAAPSDVSGLVRLLNKALELNREALKLNTPDESKRTQLLTQVNQILSTVKNQSASLTVASSQRAYSDRVFTYVGATIVAIVGTMIYAFGVSVRQKYRIKRTFQMKASLK